MILPIEPNSLKISEIFFSIQGEGSRIGLPCIFIRLHGCGLRCSYCDTPYALDHRIGGEWMGFDEILREVEKYPVRFVEFTGGEPLEQPEVHKLIARLLDSEYTVAIETGGHIDIKGRDPRTVYILDIKTPSSGMVKRNLWENIEHLMSHDEIKFVCGSREDYEWAKGTILHHELLSKVNTVIVSPVFGRIDPKEIVEWILADGLEVRTQVQLHKIIWEPNRRGV